jgi:PAS domain S-box-containing protein
MNNMTTMTANKNRRVLVIDDNREIHDDFRKILCPAPASAAALDATETVLFGSRAGAAGQTPFEVDSAYQGHEGVLLVEKALETGRPYALAFVDVRMPPGFDGVETTRKIWEIDPDVQIVICTAYSDHSWGETFEKLGQPDGLLILKKPFDAVEAFQLGHALMEKWWLHQQTRRETEELERRVAERTKELTKSDALNRAVLNSVMSNIAVVDKHGTIISVNERWERFAQENGCDAQSLKVGVGANYLEVCEKAARDLGADAQEISNGIRGLLTHSQKMFRHEYPCHSPTEERWFAMQVSHLNQAEGGAVIAHFNITERKKSEAALLNLRTAVEQSANMIVITDIRGDIEYVNPAFEKTTGYTAAEAVGNNCRILKSGERDAEFYRHLWATITTGKIWQGEFHNRRKDGSLYWEEATITPVQNDKGEVLRFLAIKEDITKRKAMEVSLGIALQRAEASAAAKSEFLAIMSHELRTPLNGVLGCAQLLADTPLDSAQMEYAETISKSGEHLLAIVSDILDFASIDAGTLALHAAPLVVADLVKTAEDTVRINAAEKGLELRCELAADVPEQITGDELRIRQILINLLGNAVKFTASGSVVLRVVPTFENGGSFLDFSVQDTGIGISSETLSHLFQPFVQADSSKTRNFGGTGLGLAISKRLAEAMGGTITVASTPEKGSTFTFRFPLEPAPVCALGMAAVPSHIFLGADGASPSSPSAGIPGLSAGALVLVVEDDRGSRMLAGKMVEAIGLRAELAADGEEAVRAFVPGKYFAILMDMSMPVMGGLEATKKIREAEAAAGCHVPIIALTANVMPGDREQCLAAGMDNFLTKPLKRAELAAILASVAQQ